MVNKIYDNTWGDSVFNELVLQGLDPEEKEKFNIQRKNKAEAYKETFCNEVNLSDYYAHFTRHLES